MKKSVCLSLLFCILFSTAFFIKSSIGNFNNEDYLVEFSAKDGMFDGIYSSKFLNGKKKAEGKFIANQRHGKWQVYDTTGRTLVIREYKNDFEFRQIFPQTNSKIPVSTPFLTRNAIGIYPYREIIEKHVVRSKRTWRYIQRNEASPIFMDDNFFNALVDSVLAGRIQAYDPVDDEFRVKLSKEIFIRHSDTLETKIFGYKIKEDWFFDSDRKTSEKRIIGICPVMLSAINGKDSVDVCWFYFPEIRNTLNAIKIEYSNYSLNVKTLDDLFFYHCFPSVIFKETNVKNQSFRDYCKSNSALAQEHLRTEIELIETEHDLWIKYPR